jgi:hypothetical protein
MGFQNDDDNQGPSRGEQIADEQIRMNKAELESKRQNLFRTRLDIIKGQGTQQWTPNYNVSPPPTSGEAKFPLPVQRGGGLF